MSDKNFNDFHERLKLQHPKRSFRLHHIDRPGIIIPVGHRLSVATQFHCLVQSVSCAGAMLNISPRTELPHNFFLVILGSSEEIGATEAKREKDQMLVKFNMFLDAGFLQSIVGTASLENDAV